MAARTISTDQTLEDLRLQFNALSEQDFGDISTLDASLSSSTLVGAMNELTGIVATGTGFYIQDDSSTQQLLGPGQTLTFSGSSNIDAIVSATDTVTVSLKNNLTLAGTNHTLGSIQINGNTISSTDSSQITIDDSINVTGIEIDTGSLIIEEIIAVDSTRIARIRSARADKVVLFPAIPLFDDRIAFEGTTSNQFETVILATDPTADRTITIPDISGTMVTTGDTGSITTSMIGDDQVTESKIGDDAVGQDQLKSVVNLQIINSSGSVLKSLFGAGA